MPDVQPPTIAQTPATQSLATRAEQAAPASSAEFPEIPGYQIVRLIGRGGMGIVYEARDESLQRTVALKMILLGAHASDKDRTRFRQEAEAVARLHHPGIVQIYEIGASATGPFLSLEFVAGGSLAEQLDGKPWLSVHAARLVEQVGEAVEAAHQVGIVHRDLKPANILINAECGVRNAESNTPKAGPISAVSSFRIPHSAFRIPKIADFGLAKRLDSDQGQTASGAILGTPAYMAPEQAEGRNRRVGPPTDVYSLGAILYELLTGRPPFLAETPFDTIMQVSRQDPVPPSRLNAKVPVDLETICLKCLRKEPERRYATAAALAVDLARFREGRPILARPVGSIERGWRWCRRNPAVAGLLLTVAVLLLAGTGVATFFAIHLKQRANDARASAADAKKNAEQADRNAEAANQARQQAVSSLYAARLNLAQNALRENRLIRLRELLKDAEPKPGERDYRGWEWHFLNRQTDLSRHSYMLTGVFTDAHVGPPSVVADSTGQAICLSTRLAPEQADGTLRLIDLRDGRVVFTREVQSNNVGAVLSGNGRALAFVDKSAIHVWNSQTLTETAQVALNFAGGGNICLALDGTGANLAYAQGGAATIVHLDKTEKAEKIPLGDPRDTLVGELRFNWPGTNLFASRYSKRAATGEVIQIDCRKRTMRPTLGPQRTEGMRLPFALSADGRLVYLPTGKRSMAVWNAVIEKQVGNLAGMPEGITAVAVSPDQRVLAVGAANGVIAVHDLNDEAASPVSLRGHDDSIFAMTFIDSILCSIGVNGEVRLWPPLRPEQFRLIDRQKARTASMMQPAFDRHGRTLAQIVENSSSVTGVPYVQVIAWDLAAHGVRWQGSLGFSLDFVRPEGRVALSDDGQTLAYVLNSPQAGSRLFMRLGAANVPGALPAGALLDLGARNLAYTTEQVFLVDLKRQTQLSSIRLPEPAQHFSLSADGEYVLAAGASWHLYDAAATLLANGLVTNQAAKHPAPPAGESVSAALFHPDGRRFVIATYNAESGVAALQLRSAADLTNVVPVPLHAGERSWTIRKLRFSPSGRYLAAIASDEIRLEGRDARGTPSTRLIVWRIENDGAVERLWAAPLGSQVSDAGPEALPLDFAEDAGRMVVVKQQRPQLAEIVVRRLETGEPVRTFRLQASGVQFASLTADRRRLLAVSNATLGADAELHVFDLVSGEQLMELPLGNVISSQGAAYHFDGHKLRIAGWNDKTGEFRMLDGSPDGK